MRWFSCTRQTRLDLNASAAATSTPLHREEGRRVDFNSPFVLGKIHRCVYDVRTFSTLFSDDTAMQPAKSCAVTACPPLWRYVTRGALLDIEIQ